MLKESIKTISRAIFTISVVLSLTGCFLDGGGGSSSGVAPQTPILLDTSEIRNYTQGDIVAAIVTARDIASGQTFSGNVQITVGDSVKNPVGIDCRIVTYLGTLTGATGSIPYSVKLLFHQDASNSMYACGEYNDTLRRYVFLTDTPTSPNGVFLQRKSPVQLGNTTSGVINLDDGTWEDCTQTVQSKEIVSIPLGLYESYREDHTCSYSDGSTMINTVWVVPSIFNIKESGGSEEVSVEVIVTGFSPSALDANFGQDGIIIDDDLGEEALDLTLQPDEKIVVVGRSSNGFNDDVLVQRYNADGSLDSSFAVNGSFIYDSGDNEIAYAVSMQSDGKIVVAGYIDEFNAGNDNVLIIRLNTDGTLDNTFGTNGIATTTISDRGESGHDLAVQPDGKLIVVGKVDVSGTDIQGLILRYNTDGSLDNSFGNGGIVQYNDAAGGWDEIYAVVLQADGKIVVTGSSSTDILVLRLNSDGSLDNSFGNSGVIHYDDNVNEFGRDVVIQSDGRIVLGGSKTNTTATVTTALIIRLNSDGTLDSTFGQNGVFEHATGVYAVGESLAISDDGKIVLLGSDSSNVLVIRVTSNGSYDSTFNSDGISLISSGENAHAHGNGVVLQSNDSIIGAGSSDNAVFLFKLTGQ